MRRPLPILLLVLACMVPPTLVACGASPDADALAKRTVVRRGFKFVLPPGDDWITREDAENQSYGLVARRTEGTFGVTLTVNSGRHPFQFTDGVDFGDQMRSMMRRRFDDARYRVDEFEVRVDARFGPLCVKRWSVVIDAAAQGVASVIPIEVHTLGYTFVVPSDRGRLVHVEYAVQGTAAEVAASDWRADAEAFMGSIEVR